MQIFDENGNDTAICLFETYLSKFIIENNRFYKNVYDKINLAIEKFILANTGDFAFDRFLYLTFSNFAQKFPKYVSFETIMASFNIQAHTEFHKQFFEDVFKKGQTPIVAKPNQQLKTLSELAQQAISSNLKLEAKLEKHLRPAKLFSKKNRSRIEIEFDEEEQRKVTCKLGIASERDTPKVICNYFAQPYEPAQFQFKKNKNGFFAQWLNERNLPFIAGPSGTLEIIFRNIIKLDTFTPTELKCYWMAASAAMVSRGHHSFAECLIGTSQLGFEFKDKANRLQFYEQFLTAELLKSPEYQLFLVEPEIQMYLNNSKEQKFCKEAVEKIKPN